MHRSDGRVGKGKQANACADAGNCCMEGCVMSQEERFGTRDRSYSAWHRRNSTRRFVGIERAQTLAMIDLDASLYVEYDDATKEPIALIETAIDCGQEFKPAT